MGRRGKEYPPTLSTGNTESCTFKEIDTRTSTPGFKEEKASEKVDTGRSKETTNFARQGNLAFLFFPSPHYHRFTGGAGIRVLTLRLEFSAPIRNHTPLK